MIKLIWATDKNNLVGKDNLLAWHYKEDLIYFKNKTKNQTVIMGDNTYQSLLSYYKDKPLPFGKIYVATIKRMFIPNVEIVNDIDSLFLLLLLFLFCFFNYQKPNMPSLTKL